MLRDAEAGLICLLYKVEKTRSVLKARKPCLQFWLTLSLFFLQFLKDRPKVGVLRIAFNDSCLQFFRYLKGEDHICLRDP